MIYKFILLFLILNTTVVAQNTPTKTKKIMMGEDSVYIHIYNPQSLEWVFTHVHENEEAALEAALQIMPQSGGKLVTLVHSFEGSKERNITFRHNASTYQIDPNRIYTLDTCVLIKTIRVIEGKGSVDTEVIKIVQNLADSIWSELVNYDYIIAVHNNKNESAQWIKSDWFSKKLEPASFSIVSYIKQNDFSSDSNLSCSDIYINSEINDSEFFIVNQRRDFDRLLMKRFNVVLQNINPIDDGSLSVFSSFQNKRYVNAEAKMGRIEEQKKMLALLLDLD